MARNQVFSVYLDHLEQPEGKSIEDYLSVIPKTACEGHVSGVAVLPQLDGKLGMLRVTRHPLGASLWEVPRGFIDARETPIQAASRELREETGLVTRPEKIIALGIVAPEPGVIAARVRLFVALDCGPGGAGPEPELGHSGLRFFTPDEIADEIAREQIQDPCTLVAYYAFTRSCDRKETRP